MRRVSQTPQGFLARPAGRTSVDRRVPPASDHRKGNEAGTRSLVPSPQAPSPRAETPKGLPPSSPDHPSRFPSVPYHEGISEDLPPIRACPDLLRPVSFGGAHFRWRSVTTRGDLQPTLTSQNNSFDHSSRWLIPSVNDALNLSDIALHQLGWRMAVLPFHCMGDTTGHALGLGMAEEISGALSRFRGPRLISTATFWDGGKPATDARRRCRTYALDYVVNGIMEIVGNDVRVTVDLLDVVLDFEPIWSRSFDGYLDKLFLLENRIVSETVAQLDAQMFEPETATEVPTEIAAAHHAVLKAIAATCQSDRTEFMRARALLEYAIELDPDYAAAHAWLAYWCIMAVGHNWADDPRGITELAGTAAQTAVSLDPLDARALAIAGHVKAYLFHEVKNALAMHEQAIRLNSNLPIVWTLSGWSKHYNGEHEAAIRHATTAKQLSPDDPFLPFTEHLLAAALLFRRQLEDAEALSENILERDPRHASARYVHLAILGHLGRREESRYWLKLLQDIDPRASVDRLASRVPLRPDDKAFYLEGLRRAGLPERAAD